jgi:hypothetical protein
MLQGNIPKEFQIQPWSKEIEEGSKYLEKGKTERESETLVLGELDLPKYSKIPWRNQGIATKGS